MSQGLFLSCLFLHGRNLFPISMTMFLTCSKQLFSEAAAKRYFMPDVYLNDFYKDRHISEHILPQEAWESQTFYVFSKPMIHIRFMHAQRRQYKRCSYLICFRSRRIPFKNKRMKYLGLCRSLNNFLLPHVNTLKFFFFFFSPWNSLNGPVYVKSCKIVRSLMLLKPCYRQKRIPFLNSAKVLWLV